MTITVTNYVTNYWILDNIIDCSEIIEEKLNNSNHVSLPEDEPKHSVDTNKKRETTNKYYIRKQPQNKNSHFNAIKNINTYNNNKLKKNVSSTTAQNYKITRLQ